MSMTTGQDLTVLYVGDWDPSGLHMSEIDLRNRLHTYRCRELLEGNDLGEVAIVRIALTGQDVEDGDLPDFDADTKRRDPRWRWYVDRYGRRCWELDALSPVVLRERVEAAIVARLDRAAWDRYVQAERLERESIAGTVRAWRGLAH